MLNQTIDRADVNKFPGTASHVTQTIFARINNFEALESHFFFYYSNEFSDRVHYT